MRTTIVIEDALWPKVKAVALRRRLSEFINRCLKEHFARQERASRMAALEKAYYRAAKAGHGVDVDLLDREDWPAW